MIPIHLPPLRERGPDIAILANHFLRKFVKLKKKNLSHFSQDALGCLIRYPWPGNVRELENLVEMLVVMKEEGDIEVSDLPPKLLNPKDPESSLPCNVCLTINGLNFKEMVSQFEKDLLLQALRKSSGVKKRAAKLLNLNRTTLVEKLKRFNLTEENRTLNEE